MRVAERAALAFVWLLLACGTKEEPPPQRLAKRPKIEAPPAPPPLFDAYGNLLPAASKVAWLELPRGFVEERQVGGVHLLSSTAVPLERLQAFYGARVLPHRSERVAGGVHFLAAAPLDGTDLPRLRIDMEEVREPKGAVTLRISLMPQASPTEQLSVSEAKSALMQDEKQAE